MMPIFSSIAHIFSHEHEHKICKAVGEKHLHKQAKKCCDITAHQITFFVENLSFKLLKDLVLFKIISKKPYENNIVFISKRGSRAPPKTYFS